MHCIGRQFGFLARALGILVACRRRHDGRVIWTVVSWTNRTMDTIGGDDLCDARTASRIGNNEYLVDLHFYLNLCEIEINDEGLKRSLQRALRTALMVPSLSEQDENGEG